MLEADRGPGAMRRLLALMRLPFFTQLSPPTLARLANQSVERAVRAGEPVSPSDGRTIRIFPSGAELRARTLLAGSSRLPTHIPELIPWLAGSISVCEISPALDGVVFSIDVTDLTAALQDEFALYLAIAREIARDIDGTGMASGTQDRDHAGRPMLLDPSLRLDLVSRVRFLRDALPLGRQYVDALFQIARHASELRAVHGDRLWTEGDPSDVALIPLRGAVSGVSRGGEVFTMRPGAPVGGLDVFARRTRGFTATAKGELVALSFPVERFIDVLEDHPDLALDVLRALSRQWLARP